MLFRLICVSTKPKLSICKTTDSKKKKINNTIKSIVYKEYQSKLGIIINFFNRLDCLLRN